MPELRPEHLTIPIRVARQYAGGNDTLADELESVCNLALVEAAANSPSSVAGFKLYLIVSCRNAVRQHFIRANAQKRGRDATILNLGTKPNDDPPCIADDPSANAERSELLEKLLSRLSPLDRTVWLLYERDGLTQAEIALRVGLCGRTVWNRLNASRIRFARMRTGRESEPDPIRKRSTRDPRHLPLGTIRIAPRSGGRFVRLIKVREDGPRSGRWVNYARRWWEENRGPVPRGKRVIHLDGDGLNDAPDNLALGSFGDVMYLAAQRDPEADARRHRKAVRGMSRSQSEKALARKALGDIFRKSIYLADHRARTLAGPYRHAHLALQSLGLQVEYRHGGKANWWMSHQLGWPDLPPVAALTLAVLAEAGEPQECPAIVTGCADLAALLGQPHAAPARKTVLIACTILRRRNLIGCTRGGGARDHRSTYWFLPAALTSRGSVHLVAPVSGHEALRLRDEEEYVLLFGEAKP